MQKTLNVMISVALLCGGASVIAAFADSGGQTVIACYPDLACGALTHARLGELPDGVLLRSGEIQVTEKDLEDFISRSWLADQLRAFRFFALEQEAARRIVASLARKASSSAETGSISEEEEIGAYLQRVIKVPAVTDAEIADYYERIKGMIPLPLEQIRDQIRLEIEAEKRQDGVEAYVRELGKKVDIVVSESWVAKQSSLAKNNPLDEARSKGRPVLAAFSSGSCCGPDTALPLLQEIERKFGDRVSVIYLDARRNQVLGIRLGVKGIPTFLLYGRNGNEVFRHTGIIDRERLVREIEKEVDGIR